MKKPYVVAELSANHLGKLNRALKLVELAFQAGADAIKLQTWSLDTMVLQRGHMWKGKDLFDLYREAWLPWEFHKPIFDFAAELGIECFSAPFDKKSVDFLETLNCPRYKIASFELVDLDLIGYVARLGKPMIMSTGMADPEEIHRAITTANQGRRRNQGEDSPADITLLKCTSAYPSLPADANLIGMVQLGAWYDVPYGLSDHTHGMGVAIVAASMGASYIEKHFTLDRCDGSPDADVSMEPHEFKRMVSAIRSAAVCVHPGKTKPVESTELRRSLHFAKDMVQGEIVTRDHLCTARPADGMEPHMIFTALGRPLLADVKYGDPVLPDHFDL